MSGVFRQAIENILEIKEEISPDRIQLGDIWFNRYSRPIAAFSDRAVAVIKGRIEEGVKSCAFSEPWLASCRLGFFQHVTLRIWGNLNIGKAFKDCFTYLRKYIPAGDIVLDVYDYHTMTVKNIAHANSNRWESSAHIVNDPIGIISCARQ